jgi:hypothetical protein
VFLVALSEQGILTICINQGQDPNMTQDYLKSFLSMKISIHSRKLMENECVTGIYGYENQGV